MRSSCGTVGACRSTETRPPPPHLRPARCQHRSRQCRRRRWTTGVASARQARSRAPTGRHRPPCLPHHILPDPPHLRCPRMGDRRPTGAHLHPTGIHLHPTGGPRPDTERPPHTHRHTTEGLPGPRLEPCPHHSTAMGRLRGTTDLFRMRRIGTTSLYVSAVVATAVPGTLLLAEWTSISIDSITLTDTHTECTNTLGSGCQQLCLSVSYTLGC